MSKKTSSASPRSNALLLLLRGGGHRGRPLQELLRVPGHLVKDPRHLSNGGKKMHLINGEKM